MKTPIHQIRNYVQQLKKAFPKAEIKYAFNIDWDAHAIFVTPEEVFRTKEFSDTWMQMQIDYFSKYYTATGQKLYFETQEPVINEANPSLFYINLFDAKQFEQAVKDHQERIKAEVSCLEERIELLKSLLI